MIEQRTNIGNGQYIDLSLLDVSVFSIANQALNYLVSDAPPQRIGNTHSNIIPYQAFETADGYFIPLIGNDQQYTRFCECAEHPELAGNIRSATNLKRVEACKNLVSLPEPILRSHNTDNGLRVL